jgi:hypothetical protein
VAPVLKAVAIFGMDRIDEGDLIRKPLTRLLAGLIAGFDSFMLQMWLPRTGSMLMDVSSNSRWIEMSLHRLETRRRLTCGRLLPTERDPGGADCSAAYWTFAATLNKLPRHTRVLSK